MFLSDLPWWAMFLLVSLTLATAVQLGLWWGVFAPFIAKLPARAPLPVKEASQPVSVVVCARNAASLLRANLPAVLGQRYPALWEVVVVDDASSDDTPEVLLALAEQYPHLRTVRIGEKRYPGKKFALEQGIRAARFDHLVFTDADCRPVSEHWLSLISDKWSKNDGTELVLGHAPFFYQKGWANAWARFENLHVALHYLALADAGMPYMGVGRNLAWKKQLFEQSGGFSKHFDVVSGDDDLLVNAVAHRGNTALCLYPEAFMPSEAPPDLQAWLRQKYRHLQAGKRYRRGHQAVLSILALSHSIHYYCIFTLLLTGFGTTYAVSLFGVRLVTLALLNRRLYRCWDARDLLPRLWLFDAGMAVYYGIGVPFFLIKKSLIAWT